MLSLILKRRSVILVILITVFCALRISILYSRPNIAHPEEGLQGILIKHCMELNVRGSVFDYFFPYEGGSIVSSLLAVPFCKVFGLSTVTLRITSIFCSTLILVMLFILTVRFFTLPAAVFACLLYIFSPPSFTHYSSFFFNAEYFILFFDLLILYLFFSIFMVPDDRKKISLLCCLGFVSGFSVFYWFSSLLFVTSIILFWYVFDKMFFKRREFGFFLISFFIGLVPFFYYCASHLNPILYSSTENPFIYLRLESVPALIAKAPGYFIFFIRSLIDSFSFEYFIGPRLGRGCNYTVFIIVLLSCLSLAWKNARNLKNILKGMIPLTRFNLEPSSVNIESLLLVIPVLFFLACFFSNYFNEIALQYRYFFPVYPVWFICISIFLLRGFTARRRFFKAMALTYAVFLLGICLYGNLGIIGKKDPWAVYDLSGLIGELRAQKIKYIYSTYFYKWQIAFESKEDVVVSTKGIKYSYFPGVPILVDWEQYGEPFSGYDEQVDKALDAGARYAYVFDTRFKGKYAMILEQYLLENEIGYEKKYVKNDFIIFYDIARSVKPKDVQFNRKWQ